MLNQYPHILKFDIITGGHEETDENGDTVIVPGTTTTFELKCRFEPNSTGEYLMSADGAKLDYGWTIYMPLKQVEVPNGIEVEGFDKSLKIASGTVKRFNRGQLNARAWV